MLPGEARQIFELDETAAFYSDRDGVIRHWSAHATSLLGYEADEMLGHSVDELIPAAYHEKHWDGYRRAIANGRFANPSGAELPVIAKGGASITLAFFGRVIRDADARVVGIASSLSEPWDEARGPFYELSGAPLHGVDIEQVVLPGDADRRPTRPLFHVRRGFEYRKSGRVVRVPEGIETDLASVPWAIWWLVAPFGRQTAPALVHDVLIGRRTPVARRRKADALFLDALGDTGMGWVRRRLMFAGVALGGTLPRIFGPFALLLFAHLAAILVALACGRWWLLLWLVIAWACWTVVPFSSWRDRFTTLLLVLLAAPVIVPPIVLAAAAGLIVAGFDFLVGRGHRNVQGVGPFFRRPGNTREHAACTIEST